MTSIKFSVPKQPPTKQKKLWGWFLWQCGTLDGIVDEEHTQYIDYRPPYAIDIVDGVIFREVY